MKTEPKKTPMLLRPDMVRAYAQGIKCRTQRVITKLKKIGPITEFGRSNTYGYDWHFRDKRMLWNDVSTERLLELCPYGAPGDYLNLLTTWAAPKRYDAEKPSDVPRHVASTDSIWTYFDSPEKLEWCGKLRPGRFMPKWMRELMPTPEILSIRARRIQEITDEECLQEGITVLPLQSSDDPSAWYQSSPGVNQARRPKQSFASLWDSINADRGYSWESNPWVFDILFERADVPAWHWEAE